MKFSTWLENEDEAEAIVRKIDQTYPRAGAVVDGRRVRSDIPNQSSIHGFSNNYEVLPGVREFPIHGFGGKSSYYSVGDQRRVEVLMQQIAQSKEINPLIIVEEKNGPYILEGGHRMSALVELKAHSCPALVVVDLESFGL